LLVFGFTSVSFAETILSYQGFIKKPDGSPANEDIDITLKLYDVESGGEALWSEDHYSVAVEDGLFSVLPGSINDLSTVSVDGDLFLELTISGETLVPRRRLTKALRAHEADEADIANSVKDGAITTNKFADGSITTSKLADASITSNKMADGVITAEKIADNAIGSEKIVNQAISSDKIADGAIDSSHLNSDLANKIEGDANTDKNVHYLNEQEPDFGPKSKQDNGAVFVRAGGVDFKANDPLAISLVIYWKMDEVVGSTVIDSVNTANDATAYSQPGSIEGKLGKALSFNSLKKQYVHKSHAENIDFGKGDFTIAFWLRAGAPGHCMSILSKANELGAEDQYKGFVFSNQDLPVENSLHFSVNSGGTGKKNDKKATAAGVFDNQWHHIVGTKKGTDIILYVDSQEKGRDSGVDQSVSTNEPLLIGSLIGDYFFDGEIDEVIIWNRSISEDEIKTLYNNDKGKGITYVTSNLYFRRSDGTEVSLTKFWEDRGLDINFTGNNVCIGCTDQDPKEKLEVHGNIKISGSGHGIQFPDGTAQFSGLPSGAVIPFDLDQCPVGWEEFDLAKGRVIVGTKGSVNGLTDRQRGYCAGAEEHQLTVEEMPAHSHSFSTHYNSGRYGGRVTGEYTRSNYSSVSTSNSGGNKPHNNMPPYTVLLYCKKK